MLGVELVTDRQKKTPAKAETLYVMDKMKGNIFLGLLSSLVQKNQIDCFCRVDPGVTSD